MSRTDVPQIVEDPEHAQEHFTVTSKLKMTAQQDIGNNKDISNQKCMCVFIKLSLAGLGFGAEIHLVVYILAKNKTVRDLMLQKNRVFSLLFIQRKCFQQDYEWRSGSLLVEPVLSLKALRREACSDSDAYIVHTHLYKS